MTIKIKTIIKNTCKTQSKKILKILGMKNTHNKNKFWSVFKEEQHKSVPNPNFISLYKARKDHGFTQQVLNSLTRDSLIRTKEINGKVAYAEEDIIVFKDLRRYFEKAKELEIIKETHVMGKKSYLGLIPDLKNKSYDIKQNELTLDFIKNYVDKLPSDTVRKLVLESLFGDTFSITIKD